MQAVERLDDRIRIATRRENTAYCLEPPLVFEGRVEVCSMQQPADGADLLDGLACLVDRGVTAFPKTLFRTTQLATDNPSQSSTNRLARLQ